MSQFENKIHLILNIRIVNCWLLSIGQYCIGDKTNSRNRMVSTLMEVILCLLSFFHSNYWYSWFLCGALHIHPPWVNLIMQNDHTLKSWKLSHSLVISPLSLYPSLTPYLCCSVFVTDTSQSTSENRFLLLDHWLTVICI